jgi:hypothetical protein
MGRGYRAKNSEANLSSSLRFSMATIVSAESLSGKRCVRDSWLLHAANSRDRSGSPARAETGRRAVCAVVGWFALVPASVAAMGAVMVVRGDPHASVPTLVLVLVATGAFWALARQVFCWLSLGACGCFARS